MVDVGIEETAHLTVVRKREGSDWGSGNPASDSGACPH